MTAALVASAAGCGERDASAPVRAPVTTAAGETRGTVQPQSEETSMIEVKADEAQAKGLPRIGFRIDPTGTPLSVHKFPEPDKYLIASGPPGGPLLAIVWTLDERDADAAALERAVRRHFSQPWQAPLELGAPGNLSIAGASRTALAFTTGQSLRRTAWCGAIVNGQGASVLVTLGRAPGPAASMSCADVVAEPSLAAFARTFALVP
jgi:hypothetical protein